jgi:methylglutaconyl-CoA hydratase
LNQLSINTDVSIVLRSEGTGAFCAGASLTNLAYLERRRNEVFSGLRILNVRKCSKIIVGRIHGKAVGGGVGIAAACDYALRPLIAP